GSMCSISVLGCLSWPRIPRGGRPRSCPSAIPFPSSTIGSRCRLPLDCGRYQPAPASRPNDRARNRGEPDTAAELPEKADPRPRGDLRPARVRATMSPSLVLTFPFALGVGGGGPYHCVELARGLRRAGCDVAIVAVASRPLTRFPRPVPTETEMWRSR